MRAPVVAAASVAAIIGGAFGGAAGADAAVGDGVTVVSTVGGLFQLSDGSQAYCLDLTKETGAGKQLVEADWNSYNGVSKPWNTDPRVRGDVLWTLAHSYPSLSAAELATETGSPVLSGPEAAQATQAAIWHFTNGLDWVAEVNKGHAEVSEQQVASYEWLISHATPISPNSAGGGSVSITKGAGFTATTDKPVGPFVVATDQVGVVSLSASDGAAIVDAAGRPSTPTADGAKFWLKATSPTTATVTASGTYVHQTGNIWVDPVNPESTQELTIGSATPLTREASVKVAIVAPTPVVSTTATDKADGDKELPFDGGTVSDVVKFEHLVPGTEYTITGELMDKATGHGTGITATKTFTPMTANGTVEVDFAVPASMAGKNLVVFEKVLDADVEVASHEDIDSPTQAVVVDEKPAVPVSPTPVPLGPTVQTGGMVGSANTTGEGWVPGVLGLGVLLAGASGILIRRTTKS